ncbi:hypothetical protein [Nocardia miyunensis]|uniref:hypothetical protein n=1 Tax=Nocardia miyunensis TaxID=282684 RepID=UPI0008357FAA|nr:hypothetical protein [Nocardia miyunensis]
MTVKSKPSQEWTLDNRGTAWAYLVEGTRVTAPVILVADRDKDSTSLEAFADTVNSPDYPFGSMLARRGKDVILVGYEADADWSTAVGTVRSAVMETKRRCPGEQRVVLGGSGWSALLARYVLADLEYGGLDHRVGVYFCLDSTKPTPAEQAELFDVGNMPLLPRSLKITTDGFADLEELTAHDDPGLSMFDDALYASASPANSSWMTEEQGRWLLDRLP